MNKRYSLVFGILILGYLAYSLQPARIIDLLLNINPIYFIAALIINVFDEVVAARILYKLLKKPGLKFKDVFLSHISGMLYSDATPAKVGYYYTAISLSKKFGFSKSENIGVLTAIQGVVFFTKGVGCLIGLLYFSRYIGGVTSTGTISLVFLVPLVGVVGTILVLYTRLPQKLLQRLPIFQGVAGYVTSMQDAVKKLDRKDFYTILSHTLFIWFLVGVQWYLIAHAIGVDLKLVDAILLRPLITAIAFIPLTPNGLGLAEGGGAILFTLIGFTAYEGLTFVLLTRLNQFIVNSIALLDLRKS